MAQPKYEGIDSVYKTKADNKDIRDLLEKLVPKAKGQMVEFSKRFKGNTEEQTCKNIFNYLMNQFTYIADGEEQVIKLPSALLKKKIGDCKSYALFTASILENLGIPYTIVYTSYNSNPIPQHVYIVTKNGCIIDAVYGKFNQEKIPIYKYKKNMNVRYMAGIGCDCDNKGMGLTIVSKEKRDKAKADLKKVAVKTQEKIKATTAKVSQGSKTIGLAPARAMFMTLISLNVDGLASKIAKSSTTNLLNAWYKLGGDRTKLGNAITKGASRPIKKLGFLPKLKKIVGNININGMGAVEIPAEIKAKIVSLCASAGTAIGGSPQGTSTGASMGGVVVALLPSLINAIKQVPSTDLTDAPLENLDLKGDIADETSSETQSDTGSGSGLPKNALLYAGGGLLVLAGIYFATKRNN